MLKVADPLKCINVKNRIIRNTKDLWKYSFINITTEFVSNAFAFNEEKKSASEWNKKRQLSINRIKLCRSFVITYTRENITTWRCQQDIKCAERVICFISSVKNFEIHIAKDFYIYRFTIRNRRVAFIQSIERGGRVKIAFLATFCCYPSIRVLTPSSIFCRFPHYKYCHIFHILDGHLMELEFRLTRI